MDTTPIKPDNVKNSLKIFVINQSSFLNEFCPGLGRQERIYIIFFHEIKLVQDTISLDRSSNIPSKIASFVIKMSLDKEKFMR